MKNEDSKSFKSEPESETKIENSEIVDNKVEKPEERRGEPEKNPLSTFREQLVFYDLDNHTYLVVING